MTLAKLPESADGEDREIRALSDFADLSPKAPEPDLDALERLGAKKYHVLLALVANPIPSAAAKTTGYDRSTIYRYLTDPDFKLELAAMRRAATEQGLEELRGSVLSAVRTLVDLLDDPDRRIRLQAGRSVLDEVYKLTQTDDITRRVQFLEMAQTLQKAALRAG